MVRVHVAVYAVVAVTLLGIGGATAMDGKVTDSQENPLWNAWVRMGPMPAGQAPQAGAVATLTDAAGAFALELSGAGSMFIGIGKRGYINVAGMLQSAPAMLPIALDPVPLIDSPDYRWYPRFVDKAIATNANLGCNFCHGEQNDAIEDSLHARATTNEYMLDLYAGTGTHGEQAGVAPGYRLDFPDKAGPCANCHAPLAALDAPDAIDVRDVEGVAREGITCEVCHKGRNVEVNTKPGVAGALQIWRPPNHWGLFAFGPYPDANGMPMQTSYQPQMRRAEFCSACHEYSNDNGVPVMETYSEWTRMAGDDPDALQCQDCHMKRFDEHGDDDEPAELAYIVNDEMQKNMHGVLRDTREIYPHTFHGASEEYLQLVADVTLETIQQDDVIQVTAMVDNIYAGHMLPTGMPFRHMLLVIEATAGGAPLEYMGEETIPDYGGALAGQPGRGFAKVLGDGTGARNVSFWNATEVIEDTRIEPAETDESTWAFTITDEAPVTIHARLLYRKFFEPLAQAKGWEVGEVLMVEATLDITPEPFDVEPDEPVVDDPTPQDPDTTVAPDRGDGCIATSSPSPTTALLWALFGVLLLTGVQRRRRRA